VFGKEKDLARIAEGEPFELLVKLKGELLRRENELAEKGIVDREILVLLNKLGREIQVRREGLVEKNELNSRVMSLVRDIDRKLKETASKIEREPVEELQENLKVARTSRHIQRLKQKEVQFKTPKTAPFVAPQQFQQQPRQPQQQQQPQQPQPKRKLFFKSLLQRKPAEQPPKPVVPEYSPPQEKPLQKPFQQPLTRQPVEQPFQIAARRTSVFTTISTAFAAGATIPAGAASTSAGIEATRTGNLWAKTF